MNRTLLRLVMLISTAMATPALGSEERLLLVVSDFDAALGVEAELPVEAAVAVDASTQQQLDEILQLLRAPRPGLPAAGGRLTPAQPSDLVSASRIRTQFR